MVGDFRVVGRRPEASRLKVGWLNCLGGQKILILWECNADEVRLASVVVPALCGADFISHRGREGAWDGTDCLGGRDCGGWFWGFAGGGGVHFVQQGHGRAERGDVCWHAQSWGPGAAGFGVADLYVAQASR